MSNSKKNKKNGSKLRIWSVDFDMIMLESLQIKGVNLNHHVKQAVLEEIVHESMPTFTADQCRLRLNRIKQAFKNYLNGVKKHKGYYMTRQVYDKVDALFTWNANSLGQDDSLMPRPEIEKPKRPEWKRIWNDDLDELLLDGLIKRGAGRLSWLKQALFVEIAEESFPNLTPDQCRDRLQVMQKIYRHQPEQHYKLSTFVLEKLKQLEHFKPKVEVVENEAQQDQIISSRMIWTEANDLKLLNAFAVLKIDATKNIRSWIWEKIAEKVMPGQITAEQCRHRNNKLRVAYKHRKDRPQSARLPPKLLAKLCKTYGGKLKKVKVASEPDICRCCGQIDNNLLDLNKDAEKKEWFLAFTGLAVEQLVRPYTKICQICEEKLAQAHKFRELCLMGDQILQTDLANAPPAEESETSVVEEFSADDEVEQKVFIKTCSVCGATVPWSDFQKHMRVHTTEQAEKDRTCKYCGKKFKLLGTFKRHVEYHVDGKIHPCKECPQKFDNAGMLRAHIVQKHKESRLIHLCTICGKVYDQATSLKFHMNQHNGVKPYKCKHCGQCFARINGLNNHVTSRHDTKRFQCSYCDMKYVQSGKLKQHILLRHEGAVLRCDVCGWESLSMKNFNIHLKSEHKAAFNQSIHMILVNGEMLVRRRKLNDSLIQTERIPGGVEGDVDEIDGGDMEQIEAEEIPFNAEMVDIDL